MNGVSPNAALAKVLLHDHLDGGVSVETLAALSGGEVSELAETYALGANTGSLDGYLRQFPPVTAALQTAGALEQVAEEAGTSLRSENVIYAEIRFAPELHLRGGLTPQQTIRSVHQGLTRSGLRHGIIVCAIRDNSPANSTTMAEIAVEARHHGVVGFDLAGSEYGNPASRHRNAVEIAIAGRLGVTIHAGEGAGPESIEDALDTGAQRIGHGVRLVDGTDELQRRVRERGVVLEICPSSNVHTGLHHTVTENPVERLRLAGHLVTINTDNRALSRTGPTRELDLVAEAFSWDEETTTRVMVNAAMAAFLPEDQRRELVTAVQLSRGS